jgi:hydroxymethylbilane synthase
VSNGTLHLLGVVISPDGREYVRAETEGAAADAETLGRDLGAKLLRDGARTILEAVYNG